MLTAEIGTYLPSTRTPPFRQCPEGNAEGRGKLQLIELRSRRALVAALLAMAGARMMWLTNPGTSTPRRARGWWRYLSNSTPRQLAAVSTVGSA